MNPSKGAANRRLGYVRIAGQSDKPTSRYWIALVALASLQAICNAPFATAQTPLPTAQTPPPAAPTPPVAAQTPPPHPLALNDLSILFPVPRTARDLNNMIALADFASTGAGRQRARLWSDKDFTDFLRVAEIPAVQVAGAGLPLKLPNEVKQIGAWFVAGIRIDAGAPGLSKEIIEQYGQQPQIRFIVQPVTRLSGDKIKVHDIAGHLIFAFMAGADAPLIQDACLPRPKPDNAAFQAVVKDIVALRDNLAAGKFGSTKVSTANRPLGVHPGLTGASAKPFRDAIKAMLEKHLSPQRLGAMAIMGLNEPEPWIFIAMQKGKAPDGTVVLNPVPGPTLENRQVAQMLNFRGGPKVVPEPTTNNLKPITCRHAAVIEKPLPKTERSGVATAEIFRDTAAEPRIREIVDIIADPKRSHFFNTDCISCHTDTRQAMERIPNFTVADVDPKVLPKEDWNVRNFGWFTSFFRSGAVEATVTRRTATETAEVLEFVNREILKR